VALADDVEFGLRVKHAGLLPRPQDGGAARDLPSGGTFRFHTQGVQLASLPDAQLVARCRAGDEDAWRELVARFSRYVFAISTQAFRLRPDDAEEVFQEVFTRTYQHLDRLRDDEAIRPWIGQLTRRLCIDHLRSSSREEIVDPDTMPGGADDAMATIDEAFAVHEAMGELSENCREILDRFFARDESYQMIGAALEIPSGTIASRISRCLARLREIFEGRNPAPGASS
jgi:RNA polymerase sigma factor (sigma-70 family)